MSGSQDNFKHHFINENYTQLIDYYQELIRQNADDIINYWYLGLIYLLQGENLLAEEVWMSVILEDLENSQQLTNELVFFLDQESLKQWSVHKINNVVIIYQIIKELCPEYLTLPLQLNQLVNQWEKEALALFQNKRFDAAKVKYQLLIKFELNQEKYWLNLALIDYELSEYQSAYQSILFAINLNNNNYLYYYYAGFFLEQLTKIDVAIAFYQQAINLNPIHLESYQNLGNLLSQSGQTSEAKNIYQRIIDLDKNNYGAYINLGNCHLKNKQINQGIDCYQKALEINKKIDNYYWLVNNIRSFNCITESIEFAQKNSHLYPENLLLKLDNYRILPFLYNEKKEIDYYRTRLSIFLENLATFNLDENDNQISAFNLINNYTNYHLHYQGQNDLYLQSLYGNFIHQVMEQKYPQFAQLSGKRLKQNHSKIKVGYISYCLKSHVVGKLSLGWIKNHNQDKFEIYSYYLGDFPEDIITAEFKRYSQEFYHFSDRLSVEKIATQIRENELDILIFLDLSMYARMSQLAGLKLAPIQCVTWLHPITSGIPTIDYFISSQLIEGETSDSHYSEKLIKLPNLSVVYTPRSLPKVEINKSKFNLTDQKITYVSSQYVSKYLPQYDDIYPQIATEVKNCQFVFVHPRLNQNNELITPILWNRIKKSFAEYQLNWQDYCLFLDTIVNPTDYWQLFKSCDVFLDTIGFTGFNSTLDALESHLPVVTLSGEFFRTRQSQGILKMIKVTDTIANNKRDYVNIATKLGIDHQWRNEVKAKIQSNLHLIYNDLEPVQALEAFYTEVVR